MLNNLGGLGSFGLNGSSSNNHAIGSAGQSLFGLDESGNSGSIMNGSAGVVNNGSMKSSNGSSNASGSTNSQQQPQQRVLVAN